MVTTTQHLFKVRDEAGSEADISLNEGDLVQLDLRNAWSSEMPPPGRFKGIEENKEDGQRCVLLEVADGMAGYDMPQLQTKVLKVNVGVIGYVQVLARRSFAAVILFNEIGALLAKTAELKARIKEAAETLDVKRM